MIGARSKAGLEPGFLVVVVLGGLNIADSTLSIPAAAEPEAYAAPDIARVIAWIAGRRRLIVEIIGPAFIAVANPAVDKFGAESGIVAGHRPGVFPEGIFDLQDAVALIAALTIPGSRRAEGLIVGVVAACTLVPVRFGHGLGAHDVDIDAPFAGDPLQDFVGCAGEVARDLLANAIRFRIHADEWSPGRDIGDLRGGGYAVIRGVVIGARLERGTSNE